MLVVLILVTALSIILSIVTSSYVPAWTQDQEAQHLAMVGNEFNTLASVIYAQRDDYLATDAATSSIVVSSPITLGISGVPLFSVPTEGIAYVNSYTTSLTVNISGQPALVSSTGSIDFNPVNRFYTNEHYTYENGAVVRGYLTQSQFRVEPVLDASVTGASNNESKLEMTLVSITADRDMVRGIKPVTIRSQVRTVQEREYDWSATGGRNLVITIQTRNPSAWAGLYNQTLYDAGIASAAVGSSYSVVADEDSCTITIRSVDELAVELIGVNVWLES